MSEQVKEDNTNEKEQSNHKTPENNCTFPALTWESPALIPGFDFEQQGLAGNHAILRRRSGETGKAISLDLFPSEMNLLQNKTQVSSDLCHEGSENHVIKIHRTSIGKKVEEVKDSNSSKNRMKQILDPIEQKISPLNQITIEKMLTKTQAQVKEKTRRLNASLPGQTVQISHQHNQLIKSLIPLDESSKLQEEDQGISGRFVQRTKSLAERMLGRLSQIVNGSKNQVFAKEDEHLKNKVLVLVGPPQNQKEPEFQKKGKLLSKLSIKLNQKIPQSKLKSSEYIESIRDFDLIINQEHKLENVGTNRKTYTEFNTLMRQHTAEFDFGNFKRQQQQDALQEMDEEAENNSDSNSEKGKNMIVTEKEQEEQRIKQEKRLKYRRAKKQLQNQKQQIASSQQLKSENSESKGLLKYDYPYPYNNNLQEEEQFRLIDEDLKDEYEYYAQNQSSKQEKNREKLIYVAQKNEFERLALYADQYPFLQLRKFILLLCKLVSWLSSCVIKHRYFERFVLFVIIFNTVMQCMDDPTTTATTPAVDAINFFFLVSYTAEATFKILGMGFLLNPNAYLRDGWNILDFTIVVTSLLPYILGAGTVNLAALRSLRVLRPLKTISKIKSLKIVLLALFSSFPYLINAIIILLFFYLIFAIAGLQLFMGMLKKRCFDPSTGIILPGDTDQPCGGQYQCPNNYVCGKMYDNPVFGVFNFDTITSSFLMVFVCVTLESWTQIMYYVFDSFTAISVIYFIIVTFIGAFFLINLTLAVIKAKFTQPEDVPENTQIVPKKTIDMHSLKMFRRMERNHLKRRVLSKMDGNSSLKKQGIHNDDERGFFNWEDLMRLKRIQDNEEVEQARLQEQNQLLEEQIMVKEKLRSKLRKAISKDTFFRKNRQDDGNNYKFREIPRQKIVFYVQKGQGGGNIISSTGFKDIDTPTYQQKKRGSKTSNCSKQMNWDMAAEPKTNSYHRQLSKSPNSRLAKQTSINLYDYGKHCSNNGNIKQQSKVSSCSKFGYVQKISFIGIGKGQMVSARGNNISTKKSPRLYSGREYQSSNSPLHTPKSNSQKNYKKTFSMRSQSSEYEVNEEDEKEIFDRFDEINKKEAEEYKKIESQPEGDINMEDFEVINNQKHMKLRKLPEEKNSLSILQLKTNSARKETKEAKNILTQQQQLNNNNFISSRILKDILCKDEGEMETQDSHIKKESERKTELKQNNNLKLASSTAQEQTTHSPSEHAKSNLGKNFTFSDKAGSSMFSLPSETDEEKQTSTPSQHKYAARQVLRQNSDLMSEFQASIFNENNGQKSPNRIRLLNNSKFLNRQSTVDSTLEERQHFEEHRSQSPKLNRQGSMRSKNVPPLRLNISQFQRNENNQEDFKNSQNDNSNNHPESHKQDDDSDNDDWITGKLTARPSMILKNITLPRHPADSQRGDDAILTDRTKKSGDGEGSPSSLTANKMLRMGTVVQIRIQRQKESKQEEMNLFGQQTGEAAQIHNAGTIHKTSRRMSKPLVPLGNNQMEPKSGDLQPKGHTETHVKKKIQKPAFNVRDWKMMVDIQKEFRSSSSSDVLQHRLKEQEKKKIEEEQVKIASTKYTLLYRQRNELKKKKKQRQARREKKVKVDKKSQSESRNDNSETRSHRSEQSSRKEQSSLITSGTNLDFIMGKEPLRLPMRKNSFFNNLSLLMSGSQEQNENSLNSSNQKHNESLMQPYDRFLNQSSYNTAIKYSQSNTKLRQKLARAAQNKEKIVFDLPTISKLISETINPSSNTYQTRLDALSNKSAYWDIRRLDFCTGVKSINIWSGPNVCVAVKKNKILTNKILKQMSTFRQDLHQWVPGLLGMISVWHKYYKNFVLGSTFNSLSMLAVLLNTAVLALSGTFSSQGINDFLASANSFFSYVFIAEMGMKIIALSPIGYIRDKINIFDGFIVSISMVEMIMFSGGSKAVSAFRAVRIFRTFRVLRVTRLLRSLKFMTTIMSVINRTIDSFMYIALLLFLFIFIYSLLGMQLYGGSLNYLNNGGIRQNYDSFYNAFLATFQIVTLENWPDILVTTMRSSIHPAITSIYLISWIFIGNYVFLNLFLAILLDGFVAEGEGNQLEDDGEESDLDEEIQTHILKMSKEDIEQEKKKRQKKEEETLEMYRNMEENRKLDLESESNLNELLGDEKEKEHKKVKLFHGIQCRDSLFLFSKKNIFRTICYKIAQNDRFENFILTLIIASSFKLVIDTYLSDSNPTVTEISLNFDILFNSLFTLESLIKIIAYGLVVDDNSYLTDTWSQLDFFIVIASMLDMCVSSINLPVIKILRLLRTLRPLRFISHNVNMKVVVIALFESVGAIANVLVVVLLIWLMFAILGMSLIGGRMGYCDVTYYYGINQDMCSQMGKNWKNFPTNFDDVASSMMTLLILSTLENWPNMMFQAQDSNTADQGPSFNNYSIISLFYIVFILVGSFFLINLFIGVIFLKFTEAQKSQKISIFLTEKQARWIEFQMMIIGVKAQFQQNKKPENAFRLFFWKIVNHKCFDIVVTSCIVANIVSMALTYETESNSWDSFMSKINQFFTGVFFTEMALKMLSTGVSIYLSQGWNKFDFFVVCSSLLDISMDSFGGQSLSFLRMGPQLIRVIRVFRVTRLLKLVRSMRGLQKLIETLLFSLPSLVNVGALMLLFFFIFSVLGVFLFKDIVTGTYISSYNNFWNFGNAMITLYRCSTGENWQYVMFDVGQASNCRQGGTCYTFLAQIYFIFFILICVFVMLNLFILVLIQYFEDYHMKEDNPLDAFNDNLNIFRSVWAKYTAFSNGIKINHKHIVNFLSELPTPLGYLELQNGDNPEDFDQHLDKHQIAKDVMEMKLSDDGSGNIFFNDCLFACMKKAYGEDMVKEGEIQLKRFLLKQELETKKKIEEKKRLILIKQKVKIFNAGKNQLVNPIVLMLFCGMAFKSWRNYIETLKNDKDEVVREESPYCFSSSSDEESDENQSEDGEEDYPWENSDEQKLENIDEQQGEDEDDEENENENNDENSQNMQINNFHNSLEIRKSVNKQMETQGNETNNRFDIDNLGNIEETPRRNSNRSDNNDIIKPLNNCFFKVLESQNSENEKQIKIIKQIESESERNVPSEAQGENKNEQISAQCQAEQHINKQHFEYDSHHLTGGNQTSMLESWGGCGLKESITFSNLSSERKKPSLTFAFDKSHF